MRPLLLSFAMAVVVVPAAGQFQQLFDAPALLPQATHDCGLLGDVDGDGDVDAIAFVPSDPFKTSFRVLTNDGLGNLTPGPALPLLSATGRFAVLADIDGDGAADLVLSTSLGHPFGAGLEIYFGSAAGPSAPLRVPLGGNVLQIGRGDAGGDPIADLLVLHVDATGNVLLRWILGDLTRAFALGAATTVSLAPVHGMATLDADGDGDSDAALLVGSGSGAAVHLLLSTPSGFVAGAVLPLATAYDHRIVAADVDGDGDVDLVAHLVPNQQQLGLQVLQNQGGGAWTAGSLQTIGSTTWTGDLYAADLDGDGADDLLLRGPHSGFGAQGAHRLLTLRNDGLVFSITRSVYVQGAATGPGAGFADLDGDGRPDFADSRALWFAPGLRSGPADVHAPFDEDGDGDLDHIVDTDLRRNDGSGEFTSVPGFWPPSPGPSIAYQAPSAFGDFDGDGLLDAVVQVVSVVFPPQVLGTHLLRGTPDGLLVDAGPAAALPQAIVSGGIVADADADGDLDVLNITGVWSNDGSGFFTQTGSYFGVFRPIAAADVDGDGDLDLLARSFVGNQTAAALLRRTAQGAYVTEVLTGSNPISPSTNVTVLADLDDDGDPDVAATVRVNNADTIHLYTNTAGVFALAQVWATNGLVLVGDFDGDGQTDIVISGTNSFAFHRRIGPGLVYAPPVVFAGLGGTSSADLDQDGDLDLCGANVTCWNRRFEGPGAGARRQYGVAGVGTAGYRPILSVVGPVRPGLVASLRLVRGLGGMPGLLVASATPADVPGALPGITAYIGSLDIVLGFGLGGGFGQPGAGTIDLPLAISPGDAGTVLYVQAVLLDAAGPIGLVHSNGIELRFGN